MDGFETNPLYRIMHPRSIAWWGASANPMGMGTVQLTQLLSMGYEGIVYPMHPKEAEIAGLKAYKHAKELPSTPDLAVFVLPTHVVPEVLEECGQAGIKRAIIVSAGFGEAGPEGKKLQDELVAIAKKHDICFIGPNCIGVVNPYVKLNTTFFPYQASAGFIGMASESGSFITQMFVHLEKFGLGFSQGFSVGNEAMVDITDCLEYLGRCPNTKVIGLYIESIRRGREFFRVAREVSKKKPIVAYYVGGSESGGKAVLSHTGALAGSDLLYSGIFKQCGILRASSIEELFDLCFVLGTQPLPKSNKMAILTHSGGPGAAAADSAERSGLLLSDFEPSTVEALKQYVPHTASVRNPVDLTFSRSPTDYTETLPKILLKDGNVDGMFMYMLLPIHRIVETIQAQAPDPEVAAQMANAFVISQCQAVAALPAQFNKPVVGGSFCGRDEPFVQILQDMKVPVLPSPERAVRAYAGLVEYAEKRRTLLEED
jgi:acetate---CoA ligase (ADP-forming) subunit alpha